MDNPGDPNKAPNGNQGSSKMPKWLTKPYNRITGSLRSRSSTNDANTSNTSDTTTSISHSDAQIQSDRTESQSMSQLDKQYRLVKQLLEGHKGNVRVIGLKGRTREEY